MGSFGAEPDQVQYGSEKVPGYSRKPRYKAESTLTASREGY